MKLLKSWLIEEPSSKDPIVAYDLLHMYESTVYRFSLMLCKGRGNFPCSCWLTGYKLRGTASYTDTHRNIARKLPALESPEKECGTTLPERTSWNATPSTEKYRKGCDFRAKLNRLWLTFCTCSFK